MDHGGMDMTTEMNMGTTMNMNGGGGHSHHMMMMMYFHTGTSETVLFKAWKVTDVSSLVWSCVVIALMAFLYEGLKFIREALYQRAARERHSGKGGSSASTAELAGGKSPRGWWCSEVFNSSHLLQTLLHALQFFVSYLLMLIFMTYNVWLCLAVIVGAAAGFFLFGWKKQSAVDSTEHCQ